MEFKELTKKDAQISLAMGGCMYFLDALADGGIPLFELAFPTSVAMLPILPHLMRPSILCVSVFNADQSNAFSTNAILGEGRILKGPLFLTSSFLMLLLVVMIIEWGRKGHGSLFLPSSAGRWVAVESQVSAFWIRSGFPFLPLCCMTTVSL